LKKFFLIFAIITSFLTAANVIASVDAKRISLGQIIKLTVEISDSGENPDINISSIEKDFTIISGPFTQTSFKSVNGRISSSRSHTWSITPNREGILMIPSFHVNVGSKIKKTNPIKIEVQKGKIQSKHDDIILIAELDKKTAYPGEQITIEYKLYTKVDLSIKTVNKPDFVGFWAEELFQATQLNYRKVYLNGEQYNMAKLFKYALFATKTGKVSIPELKVKCNVVVENQSKRRSMFDTFFDDPFFSRQQTVPKIVQSEKKTIEVKTFPAESPADFSGAVGEFTLYSEIDRTSLPVNDAITLNVKLKGTGNLSLVNLPDIQFPEILEVFPPSMDLVKDPFRDQITGSINWEYILIPRQTGKFTIPRIELPYFNPKTKKWERAVSNPISFSVVPGKTPMSTANGFRKEEVELLGKDIRYFRSKVSDWKSMKTNHAVNNQVIGLYIVALVMFLLPFGLKNILDDRKGSRENRNSKNAIKIARKKLKQKTPDPFTQVTDVIYPYLKDRFLLTTEQLDPHSVKMIFSNKISETDLEELVNILQLCDAGKYAPDSAEIQDSIKTDVISLLKRIDANE